MSALALAVPLARSSEGMKAGPIGLAVILVLCIVCYFLFKSMSNHLKKVRDNFPSDDAARATGPSRKAARSQPTPHPRNSPRVRHPRPRHSCR